MTNSNVNSKGKTLAKGGSPRKMDMGRDLSKNATNVVKSHSTANIHSEVSPGSTAASRNKSFKTGGLERSS